MDLKNIFKFIFALIVLLALPAYGQDQQILCPPANFVASNWQKLDTIVRWNLFGKLKFGVYTSDESIHDDAFQRSWTLATGADGVNDFNSAFNIGQTNIQSVTTAEEKYARIKENYYVCDYLDNLGHMKASTLSEINNSSHKITFILHQ